MTTYKIAILLTCFNRCKKTVKSILSLIDSIKEYNNSIYQIEYEIFLTDDGCTDGTSDTIRAILNNDKIHIIKSDGNAFWAGGMRIAWVEAMKYSSNFDYFILLNDDTVVDNKGVNELLTTDQHSFIKYKKHCVCTGFISDPTNKTLITYGAKKYKNSLLNGAVDLIPSGTPQLCEMPNANLLLVHKDVVNEIGILSAEFIHGAADWDYGLRAKRKGIPVLATANICGYCEFDHDNSDLEGKKVRAMTFSERKSFLNRPTHIYRDGLVFNYRYFRLKYYIIKIAFYLNLYFPSLFYVIFKRRGH